MTKESIDPQVSSEVDKARRRSVEEQFVLFETAEECARAAAPVFAAQQWRWASIRGIPDEQDILNILLALQSFAGSKPNPHVESGRLIFYRGKFGYEWPKPKGMVIPAHLSD